MQTVIESLVYFYKSSKLKVNVPFINLAFLFIIIVNMKGSLSKSIDLSNFTDNLIFDFFLNILLFPFDHLFLVVFIVFILIIIILVIMHFNITNFFPKSVQYTDGTEESWNGYAAVNRLGGILKFLATDLFIIIFIISVLANSERNILVALRDPIGYWNLDNVELHIKWIILIGFTLNLLISFHFIIKSIFLIRVPINTWYISHKDFQYYTVIARFPYTNYTEDDCSYSIIKKRYITNTLYYLVHTEYSFHSKKENKLTNKMELKKEGKINYYEVVNKSNNFEEIKYHYEMVTSSI